MEEKQTTPGEVRAMIAASWIVQRTVRPMTARTARRKARLEAALLRAHG